MVKIKNKQIKEAGWTRKHYKKKLCKSRIITPWWELLWTVNFTNCICKVIFSFWPVVLMLRRKTCAMWKFSAVTSTHKLISISDLYKFFLIVGIQCQHFINPVITVLLFFWENFGIEWHSILPGSNNLKLMVNLEFRLSLKIHLMSYSVC